MRLIDSDAISLGVAEYVTSNAYLGDTALDALKKVMDWIVAAPTIDAEPVRHGRWKKHTYWIGSWGENEMVCSVCEKKYKFHADYNYCPNCGAKMDGGAEDG